MRAGGRAAGGVAAGGVALSDEERLAWLRLIRSDNVGPAGIMAHSGVCAIIPGPATFRTLVHHYGSAEAAIAALPDLARRGGADRGARVTSRAAAEAEIEAAERIGVRFVALGEPLYPPWLRHGDAAPPLIAVRGGTGHLTRPAIAIVGARNASAAGRKMAAILARNLGDAEFMIVSGLARGIDAAAHEAALSGGTIAVSPAAPTSSIRPRTRICSSGSSPPAAAASAKCRSARSRAPATSPAATGSSPAWRWRRWSSRLPSAPGR